MSSSSTSDGCGGQTELISRPPNQLHDFPVQYRWEVSRRHPYYLVFWQDALAYRQGRPSDAEGQTLLRQAAMLILGAIGITGEPVDPSTGFEEIVGSDADPAFLAGSVQPITLRSVVTMLIHALPAAERVVVGAILTTSGSAEYARDGDDSEQSQQKLQAMSQLMQIASQPLDSCADAPLFYIHLDASQRTIASDLEEQVRRWKRRRGISERRIHTRKLQSYLDVWDRREGWTGGGYEWAEEHSFMQISRQLRASLSTVVNRYRSAFQLITGHEFSPALWWRLFGPVKFSTLFQNPADALSRSVRRRLQSPVRRPVPDSVVTPRSQEGSGDGGIVNLGSAVCDDVTLVDLRLDLEDLISRGLSNEEIARRLGVDSPEAIAQVRGRLDEFRETLR